MPGHSYRSKRSSNPGGSAEPSAAQGRPEEAGERRDVPFAAPQRRELDAPDSESVEKIVAEASRLHLAVEIASRRRDEAHVDALEVVAAEAAHLLLLDRAQELRLERHVEVAYFVDEKRAAVGLLEETAPRRQRAGERAALVPEELRVEQGGRHRGAVEHDERAVLAIARLVERLGEHFLPRSGLPLDEHGHVGRRAGWEKTG